MKKILKRLKSISPVAHDRQNKTLRISLWLINLFFNSRGLIAISILSLTPHHHHGLINIRLVIPKRFKDRTFHNHRYGWLMFSVHYLVKIIIQNNNGYHLDYSRPPKYKFRWYFLNGMPGEYFWDCLAFWKPAYIELNGRDCDMVEMCEARKCRNAFSAIKQGEAHTRNWDEGPSGWFFIDEADYQMRKGRHTRDRIMEAYENGKGTSVVV